MISTDLFLSSLFPQQCPIYRRAYQNNFSSLGWFLFLVFPFVFYIVLIYHLYMLLTFPLDEHVNQSYFKVLDISHIRVISESGSVDCFISWQWVILSFFFFFFLFFLHVLSFLIECQIFEVILSCFFWHVLSFLIECPSQTY